MKNLCAKLFLLILVDLFFFMPGHAQTFFAKNKLWIETMFSCNNQAYKSSILRTSQQETSINDTLYLKLSVSHVADTSDWVDAGYLREDNKKIFYRRNNKEKLLYDFNMQVGDSILPYGYDEDEFYLHLDSIVDKEDLKHFYLSNKFYNYKIIEWRSDIGSFTGLLEPGAGIGLTGGYNELICVSVGDSSVYHNPNYEDCFLAATISTQELDQLEIYPNPNSGSFTVSVPQYIGNSVEVSIINIQGRLIYKNAFRTSTFQIHLEDPGIYFCRLRQGKTACLRKLIIH